jgi:hypothetical protein
VKEKKKRMTSLDKVNLDIAQKKEPSIALIDMAQTHQQNMDTYKGRQRKNNPSMEPSERGRPEELPDNEPTLNQTDSNVNLNDYIVQEREKLIKFIKICKSAD